MTLAIILWCQKWIITEVKVQIGILECTGIMGQDLVHPSIQCTAVLCGTCMQLLYTEMTSKMGVVTEYFPRTLRTRTLHFKIQDPPLPSSPKFEGGGADPLTFPLIQYMYNSLDA